jgi:hypothetical protein
MPARQYSLFSFDFSFEHQRYTKTNKYSFLMNIYSKLNILFLILAKIGTRKQLKNFEGPKDRKRS